MAAVRSARAGLGPADGQHGPVPAAQAGLVVLGCGAPVGELDLEEQRRVPGQACRGGRGPAPGRRRRMGLHVDLHAGREGEDLPDGYHQLA